MAHVCGSGCQFKPPRQERRNEYDAALFSRICTDSMRMVSRTTYHGGGASPFQPLNFQNLS